MQNEITQLAIELYKQFLLSNKDNQQKDYLEIADQAISASKSFFKKINETKKQKPKNYTCVLWSESELTSSAFTALKNHFDWSADIALWDVYLNSSEINNLVLLDCYNISICESRIPKLIRRLGSKSIVKRFNGVGKRCYVLPPLAKNEGAKS
jgi:hypothetical protein